ncbi:MAG TPA: TolC family protein [Pirellulaceae bacterium]|nr:TolC family protein [Pirellulaceae bacterium]HMO93598.1 TolC family protein [Pirellulaceae bacterium]HMP70522.1 TolC family protein [Pirellulaceae bacterium]
MLPFQKHNLALAIFAGIAFLYLAANVEHYGWAQGTPSPVNSMSVNTDGKKRLRDLPSTDTPAKETLQHIDRNHLPVADDYHSVEDVGDRQNRSSEFPAFGSTSYSEILAKSNWRKNLEWGLLEPPVPHEGSIVPTIPQEHQAFSQIQGPQVAGQQVFSENHWWSNRITKGLGTAPDQEALTLDELLYLTLRYSPKILSISQTPLIREAEVNESQAVFDPELFARTRYDDRTDPVGNLLTTGGDPFLESRVWSASTGLRKRLPGGGSIDLEQRLAHENNNSQFFDPQNQGTATLSLNYSQPLLRGAGRVYNRSQIVIAELVNGISWDTFFAEVQEELFDAIVAYWRLYYARAALVLRNNNVERGQLILDRLQARSEFDAMPTQITRAKAAIEQRRTELANSVRDVQNAETEIRRITANPDWYRSSHVELIPVTGIAGFHQAFELSSVVTTALEHRTEIQESIKRARTAAIAADLSRNEMLPELSLIFGTYVSGLEGNSRVLQAWSEQFTNTTPGFYGGMEFSIPYQNRAARSRLQQRRLQLVQIKYEVDATVQQVIADAQVALRTFESAYQTAASAIQAVHAAENDLRQHSQRWESFGLVEGDLMSGVTAATVLDQLLDAQQRLTAAELIYVQAIVDYKIAEAKLKVATGTLLIQERVTILRGVQDNLPVLELDR